MSSIQLKYLRVNEFFIYKGRAYLVADGFNVDTQEYNNAWDIALAQSVRIDPNEYVLI